MSGVAIYMEGGGEGKDAKASLRRGMDALLRPLKEAARARALQRWTCPSVPKLQKSMMPGHSTAIIEREGDGYVSLRPELDIAGQGETVDEAHGNLKEALELFFEAASATEIAGRLYGESCMDRTETGSCEQSRSGNRRRR